MLNFLYNLIIFPLYQIIEVVYLVVYKIFSNSGFAVIGVSVAVTFLCLPLYIIAEKWQQIERDKQKEMKPGIDRIKAVFKGDEQYMILSTFYKQNNYHPLMALRSSISLLIQIPFFIAAYKYLSNLEELRGFSFYFIKDMGSPDAMFKIGNFNVNILPIAMTIINIIAGAIYTKGFTWKEKAPIYGMALVFLVILYDSPSGLVLYWTMNNVFSLIKNIFYKMKHPIWVLYICLSAAVLSLDFYLIFFHTGFLYRRIMLVAVSSIVLISPLLLKFIRFLLKTILKPLCDNQKECRILFFISSVTLVILLGITLPSFVMASSPVEFSFIDDVKNPLFYLFNTISQMCGFFLVWITCIYFLFGKEVKTIITVLVTLITFSALINGFAFGGDYGNLTPILTFSSAEQLKASNLRNLLNLLILLIPVIILFLLLAFSKEKYVTYVTAIACFALISISFVNCVKISKGYKIAEKAHVENASAPDINPIFSLSKTKQNVFIIMLDRAISPYIPEILEEKPELKDKLDGFIFYPNTVSSGDHTLVGVPPVYGGYDYTPIAMNKRDSEPLVQKHNEALLLMPRLFSDAGFDVTVTDSSWANYSWNADLSIYDDYPEIKAISTIKVYTDLWLQNHPESSTTGVRSSLIKRNFIWYSFLKTMPTVFRDTIYNDGFYWNTNKSIEDLQDVVNNYAVLDYLPELTSFDNSSPTYTFMVNELTHEPAYLQAPDYIPLSNVTDKGTGPYADEVHFHANIAALLRISEWLDYLKENNAYDNTRIIIVADHGAGVVTDQFNGDNCVNRRLEAFNPLLMEKDFNAHGELKTDNTFMFNGDVPYLSAKDILENPLNPYTGNPIDISDKEDGIMVLNSNLWSPDQQYKNQFKLHDDEYFKVKDNIFDNNNWSQLTKEQAYQEKN